MTAVNHQSSSNHPAQSSIPPLQLPDNIKQLIATQSSSTSKVNTETPKDMRDSLYNYAPLFYRTAEGSTRTQATRYQPKTNSFWNPTTEYALEQFLVYIADHIAKGNANIIGIENYTNFKKLNPEKPVILSYITHSMQTLEIATFALLIAQASGKKAAVAVAPPMLLILGPRVCRELNIISTDEIEARIQRGEDVIVLSDGFEGANTSNICEETVGIRNGQGNVRADILTSRTGLARIAASTGAAMSVIYSTGADHIVAVQPRCSDFLASTFKLPAFAIDPRSLVGGPTNKQHAPLTFFCGEIKCPPQDDKPHLHGLASLYMHRIKEVISSALSKQLEEKTLDQWTRAQVDQVIAEAQEHNRKIKRGEGTAEERENQQLKPLDKNGLNLLIKIQKELVSRGNTTTTTTINELFESNDYAGIMFRHEYESLEKDIRNLIGNEFSQYTVYGADVLGTAGNRGDCNFAKAEKATEQLLHDTIGFNKFISALNKRRTDAIIELNTIKGKKDTAIPVDAAQKTLEEINKLDRRLVKFDTELNEAREIIISQNRVYTEIWFTDLTQLLIGRHTAFDLEKHLETKPTAFPADLLTNIKIHIANLKQREQLVAAIDVRVHELERLFAYGYTTAYNDMPVPVEPENCRLVSNIDTSQASTSSIKTPILKFGIFSPFASFLPASFFRPTVETELRPLAPSSFTRLTEQTELAEKQLELLGEWETFEQKIRGSWMPTAGEMGAGALAATVYAGGLSLLSTIGTAGLMIAAPVAMLNGAEQRVNKDLTFMRI